jgi:hypothetical protein
VRRLQTVSRFGIVERDVDRAAATLLRSFAIALVTDKMLQRTE